MKCLACGKELGKKEVLFTEEKEAYCVNPFTCTEEHPNSVKNIVARGGAVRMYTEEELESSMFDRFNVSDEMKKRVIKITQKPQSIRLKTYDISYYLLQLQATKGLASISEAVRYCVNATMQMEPIDASMLDLSVPPEDESSDDVVNLTDIKIDDVIEPDPEPTPDAEPTKSAQELIMEQIKQQQETEQEDEFSF